MEIADIERLPSMCTGKLLKVPNYILINNHVMIYGHTITKAVVSSFTCPTSLIVGSGRR